MKTDKQLYKIFEAVPEWIFQLAGLPSPGKGTLRSLAIKALERHADGVVIPESPDQPLAVVEFQFQKDATVYTRTVIEMASVQQSHQMRPVQGLIFFGYNGLDPQTEPWTRVVRTFYVPDVMAALERSQPDHPLVAVFKPMLVDSEATLEREAAGYYRTIQSSPLPPACKATLAEVFVSWLEQRLKHKGKKEIEMVLLDELPELEETQSGKDLIHIGERRGEARGEQRGLAKAIRRILTNRHGPIPAAIDKQIRALRPAKADRLLQYVLQCETLEEVAKWLASNRT